MTPAVWSWRGHWRADVAVIPSDAMRIELDSWAQCYRYGEELLSNWVL